MVEKRDSWLNPPVRARRTEKAHTDEPIQRSPYWLADAHRTLDEAVFAAYGWPPTLTDAELLERLLALNS